MSDVRLQAALPPDGGGSASSAPRFAFLDGLRAIGAIGVAALHIHDYGPLSEPARSVLPGWIWTACDHGWMGVQLFFVLSGFVIAHSLRNVKVSAATAGDFVLRRFLRLSPPYWVTIAIVSLLLFVPFDVHRDTSMDERPAGMQLLAHVFYLQNFFGYENISTGLWMVCIEMQFYVFYVLLLWGAQRVSRPPADPAARWGGGVSPRAWMLLLWLPGLMLLFFYQPAPDSPMEQWTNLVTFDVQNWVPYFFGVIAFGIVTYAALHRWIPAWTFWIYAAIMLHRLVIEWAMYGEDGAAPRGSKAIAVALTTGLAIYMAGRRGAMDRWLNFAPLLALGRISYSFFLIHFAVSFAIKTIGFQLTGTAAWPAVGWMILSFVASIPAAYGFYVVVEEPALRWSRRIGQTQPSSAPAMGEHATTA